MKQYIERNPCKSLPEGMSQEGFFFQTVAQDVKFEAKKFGITKGGVDRGREIINGWNKNENNKSTRGNSKLARAVFYWFFRFGDEPSFFTRIARIAWKDDQDLCRRFCFAKEGSEKDESFDAMLLRFASDEALSHKVIFASDPPPSGSIAVYTEADAEKALRDIVRAEFIRDQRRARKQLSQVEQAERQNRIDALSAYAERASDTTALAPWLTSLFAVTSWTDAEAFRRRQAYGTLGAEFFKKMDLRRSHVLKMGMELAHVLQVNGNHQGGAWVLSQLPELEALPDDPTITQAFLRRADTVYPMRDVGASALAEFIGDRFGRKCSREGASMWRCAACASLKLRNYENALACVDESRRHLHVMPRSTEEQLIPLYLETIEIIAGLHLNKNILPVEKTIATFERIIVDVMKITADYEPFLIGIRSEIIKLRLQHRPRRNHNAEQNLQSLMTLKNDVEKTIGSQIRVMCFFDFDDIEQEIFSPAPNAAHEHR